MGSVEPCARQWDADTLRTTFCQAMSDMYKQEVPLYGDLLSMVAEVDDQARSVGPPSSSYTNKDQVCKEPLPSRHRVERHGAIRLGTGHELRTIARLFALFNMHPVGYYDLSVVGFPLHATAFRPLTRAALAKNPFRVFTSVLRLDLLPDNARALAEQALSKRNLFTNHLMTLLDKAETEGTLTPTDQNSLITESLKIFRWHSTATVTEADYLSMNTVHPMTADIASFPSAHINHLTPRTLNIDLVQEAMKRRNMPYKDRIEGPPSRTCPILLRQTSFQALEELVRFDNGHGGSVEGHHTARFGEVEQRGAAVTPAGRRLYDELLAETNEIAAHVDTSTDYESVLGDVFQQYPDTWTELQARKLVFFRYVATATDTSFESQTRRLSQLIRDGHVRYEPIVYEDFLPVSAAGIFTSNLKSVSHKVMRRAEGNVEMLERDLGTKVADPMDLYQQMQDESLEECRLSLGLEKILVD